jgi:polar amino acid transport system permease protein/polar amino acid transport system substrate-binding protein
LQTTLLISFLAIFLGVVLGVTIASFKLSSFSVPLGKYKLKPLNMIASIYIDIFRGTPVYTQLLIIYFIILTRVSNGVVVVSVAFGLNSAAYVAEIIRAGILSIDKGQTEAGRSLGLKSFQTMRYIILPQAVKNILPALGNEFIVLIKETAVAGSLPVTDLTKVARNVQSNTFDFLYPLVGTAIVYYLIIKILSLLLSQFEKRLRKSDLR